MAYTVLDSKNINKTKNIYTFGGSGTKPERDDIAENSKLIDYSSGEKFYYDPTKAAGSKWQPDKEPSGGGSGGSLPANFPEEDAANANKFVGFDENGDYTAKDAPEEIPPITGKNGKILGVTLDAQEHEQTEWVNPPESPFFDVPFTNNGTAWVPTNITVTQILAAHAAGKLCRAVVNLDTGVNAYGFLNVAVVDALVTFEVTIALSGNVSTYILVGQIVPNDDDNWGFYNREFLPPYSDGDANRVLTVVSDGEGGYIPDWVTPQ